MSVHESDTAEALKFAIEKLGCEIDDCVWGDSYIIYHEYTITYKNHILAESKAAAEEDVTPTFIEVCVEALERLEEEHGKA